MATDIKKFLDQQGVSTLWSKIVDKVDTSVKAEADRAKQAEQANANAIAALDTKVGTLPGDSASVIAYINKKTEGIATDAALAELQGAVETLGNDIDAIEKDYLTSVDEAALEKLISDEADRADKAEKANAAAIQAISDDYLKAADKTELEGKITAEAERAAGVEEGLAARIKAVEDDYLVEDDKTELSNAIALKADASALAQEVSDRETAVSGLQTQINTIMNNPDAEGAINSINEFTKYVEEHGTIADGFRADIDKNKEDIAAMDTAYKAADTEIKGRLDVLEAINHEAYKAADEALEDRVNAEIAKKVDATALTQAVEALEGADTAIKGRLDVVEAALGTGEGSVADQIADAEQRAKDAAAADATSKANAAESNAKAHADSLNTAMNTRVEVLEAIDHDHSNKEVLDEITSTKVSAWDAALQAADIATGTANGTISIKGTDVAVKGLGSAAYAATSAFDVAGSAADALADANEYTDTSLANIKALTTAEIEAAINGTVTA